MEEADFLRKPTKSSFFKVLIGDYATKLLIPVLFVHRFRSVIPESVTLIRASSNKSWRTDIVEEDDKKLYFKRGWKKFVEDNGLEFGDFIVFKFDGNSTFKVKIFGKSACEKEVLDLIVTDQNYYSDNAGIQNQKQIKMPIPQENQKQRNPVAENCKQERTDCEERRASKKEGEEERNEVIVIEPDDLIRKTGMHKRPMQKAFSDKSILDSKNPSFRVLMKQAYTKKGSLCIPTEFYQRHMRKERQRIEIETSKGSWTVTLVPSKRRNGAYGRFSAGWTECARGNRFKTGETLLFQMVWSNNCPKFIVHTLSK